MSSEDRIEPGDSPASPVRNGHRESTPTPARSRHRDSTPPATGRRSGDLEVYELEDPRAMRAITHPVRLALLEVLALEGPLTATKAGELIGESPTTCSFHFRQLAKYGFVEEAGSGPGRSRPWRLTRPGGMRFSDVHDDPATTIAARALDQTLRQRYFSRLQAFYDTRSSYPKKWQEVTGGSEFILHVTPDELRALDQEITEILKRFQDRFADPARRPEGSLPVEVVLFAYPVRAPRSRD